MKQIYRTLVGVTLAILVTFLATGFELVAQETGGSGGRARVLVAEFHVGSGIDDDFGEDIAEELRELISDFDLLTSIDEDDIDDMLDEFDLESRGLDLVSWRQLAGRMDAQLIIWGEVSSAAASSGNQVDAIFVDAQRGEQTDVPGFTVPGDGGDEAESVAQQIAGELDRHVEFLRSQISCQDYLASSQYDDAARNCDRALEINPESPQTLFLRGRIDIERENWEEARQYLSQVLEHDSAHQDAINSLAYANAQLGNMDRANELYQQYLEFNPDAEEVRLTVAYNLASAGGFEGAMEIVETGLERDSTSAPLWKYLGDLALQLGSGSDTTPEAMPDSAMTGGSEEIEDASAMQRAADAYERYISIEADTAVDRTVYRSLVLTHLQLENYEEAEQYLDRALEAMGEDASLWSLRADLKAERGDFEEAVASMDTVLRTEPDRPNAHFKKGVLALRGGMDDVAMEEFQLAVDEGGSDPDQIANAIFGRGFQNHFQNDRNLEAASMFETALEFAETPETTQQIAFFAGYAYYRAGEAIDQQNEEAEACQPAREALAHFEEVLPYLNNAGNYQPDSQSQVRQAVDTQLYRQEQIIKASC